MNVILTDQNILDRLWSESKGGFPWMPKPGRYFLF
jgi:hypothetical protein